ncbi:biotin--protein ligase 2 isoform X1 [Lactuca sativa]|uniref:BPL/LPL catalytic domain-containing protein n=1 Tax=Lactuca sativa TaxID=4236 RepID=A0A9R1W7Z5_LACSA|nr:biotin--protein ligase 2 isoform X1 [Lactuca sativa]KAJ0217826.1 hypothetical protein LSAT_V11C300126160 [Lactuca sativa]
MLFNTLRTSFHCFLPLHHSFSFTRPSYSNIFSRSLSVATASANMESQRPVVLVLSGKSESEKEFARSLKENSTLKIIDDVKLQTYLHSEMETQSEKDEFNIDTYMNSLETKCFGRFILWSPRLPSTQDIVSLNFFQLPIGSVCIADLQFKGRGRSQNTWESPKGSLLLSFTMQMENGQLVPLVQYVVCLAMTEAIKNLSIRNGIPPLDVRIKWPNDLYLNGLKVGGILCGSTYQSKIFNISVGVGLNVDNDKPTTSLNSELQKLNSDYKLQREDITSTFFDKFEHFFHILIHQGFQPLEELYYKTWLHSGQRVIVQEKNQEQDLPTENVVTVQGLTSSGYLLAITDNGERCELHPDGNSFDFFKGLVRSKLA